MNKRFSLSDILARRELASVRQEPLTPPPVPKLAETALLPASPGLPFPFPLTSLGGAGGGTESALGTLLLDVFQSGFGDGAEMPGFLQMVVGMADAQIGALPKEMILPILHTAQQVLATLVEKYSDMQGMVEAAPIEASDDETAGN